MLQFLVIFKMLRNSNFFLPSSTSIPSAFKRSLNRLISSFSSRINFALASSFTTALQTICFARSAYLEKDYIVQALAFGSHILHLFVLMLAFRSYLDIKTTCLTWSIIYKKEKQYGFFLVFLSGLTIKN